MTLTNPTDDQLNAAFAEKVAGWTLSWDEDSGGNRYEEWWNGLEGPLDPIFTTSADAVLPFLEKRARAITITYCDVTVQWTVEIIGFKTAWKASSETLPRAIVYALLRAHGVEVNFT